MAYIVKEKVKFREVIGIPEGGVRFAQALERYKQGGYPTLIVDDVLTTGASMEAIRKKRGRDSIGIVLFARGECPNWITPLFRLSSEVESDIEL